MIQRKRLLEKINHLGATEHMEILKIVNDHGVPTTENKNGVFFNMTTLTPEAFHVVEEFVTYCYDNKIELDKYDQKLHECKYYNKNPAFASAYGVNEPKNKRAEIGQSNMSDAAVQRAERMENSVKMNDFVRKLCSGTDGDSNKRGAGSFTTWKKKFMKRSVADVDVMLDLLENDKDFPMNV
jgi:hypothetical protein